MLVGEFSTRPNTDYMRRRSGGQLLPRTKAHLIWAPRRFFNDIQEWEWIERRFDARRAFRLPRSIGALIGPDPRVIADEVWAKLMWAGLNLTAEDLPLHANRGGTRHAVVSARARPRDRAGVAVLRAANRRDPAPARRRDPLATARPSRPAAERVCLLDVPTSKTATAFTKPVDPLVGDAIDRLGAGPAGAPEVHRPPRPASSPTCCSASAARSSARATSTGCWCRCCAARPASRARTSAARSPGIAPGRRSPPSSTTPRTRCRCSSCRPGSDTHHRSSTQHYARITPTTLTKAYTDAGYFARNVRTIEVLLDRDAITNGQAGSGGPFEFYDLGHGYCSYSFFEQCPHRMACARCDFYIPKPSSEAQLLEAKDGLQRMLVQIPLTDEERAAAEHDQDAVDRLLDRLTDTPTPAGPTPRDLDAGNPDRVELDVRHQNGSSDADC